MAAVDPADSMATAMEALADEVAPSVGYMMLKKTQIESITEIVLKKPRVPNADLFPAAQFPDPGLLKKLDVNGMIVEK